MPVTVGSGVDDVTSRLSARRSLQRPVPDPDSPEPSLANLVVSANHACADAIDIIPGTPTRRTL